MRAGSHQLLPGAVRASAGAGTPCEHLVALGEALRTIAASPEARSAYRLSESGEFVPATGQHADRQAVLSDG